MSVDWTSIVRQVAGSMKLLDEQGRLVRLDSMSAIDLVVEIESVAGVEIPAMTLRAEAFESIETLAKTLAEI